MGEYRMKNTWIVLAKIIVFILFVGLVIFGQRTVGRGYLLIQLIGLAGIVLMLWDYNRKFV